MLFLGAGAWHRSWQQCWQGAFCNTCLIVPPCVDPTSEKAGAGPANPGSPDYSLWRFSKFASILVQKSSSFVWQVGLNVKYDGRQQPTPASCLVIWQQYILLKLERNHFAEGALIECGRVPRKDGVFFWLYPWRPTPRVV